MNTNCDGHANVSISVIVPTYNHARYIGRTLTSILDQTYTDFEIIIIDDGSTDNTKAVVENFKDYRIRYFYQENRGACAARNHGISKARGKYLLFEDADDFLESEHFEKYIKVAIENPGVNTYGPAVKVRFVNGEMNVLALKGKCPGSDLLEHWLCHWAIHPNCILWARENVEKVGKWDETLHANQDGDFAMRALIKGIRFVFVEDAPPAKYLRHENESEQISSTFNNKTISSKIRVLEKIEKRLVETGNMKKKYKTAIGEKYYEFARLWLHSFPDISDACFRKFKKLNGFQKPSGSYVNWIMIMLFGLRRKERIADIIGGYIPWRF
ncbi:glycosyltransferase family A protein [Desulfobacter postgatei]|uniref:glycosyltransferase family 2 protein n=1 Tax=Desulfobacter postgatei TaxID=2293 RepID=UPI00259B3D52|nr:glycosyltransferase family A protein [uncultured Desulfobacter sp.]